MRRRIKWGQKITKNWAIKWGKIYRKPGKLKTDRSGGKLEGKNDANQKNRKLREKNNEKSWKTTQNFEKSGKTQAKSYWTVEKKQFRKSWKKTGRKSRLKMKNKYNKKITNLNFRWESHYTVGKKLSFANSHPVMSVPESLWEKLFRQNL